LGEIVKYEAKKSPTVADVYYLLRSVLDEVTGEKIDRDIWILKETELMDVFKDVGKALGLTRLRDLLDFALRNLSFTAEENEKLRKLIERF